MIHLPDINPGGVEGRRITDGGVRLEGVLP